MSRSQPIGDGSDEDIPSWLTTMDEETFYTAPSSDEPREPPEPADEDSSKKTPSPKVTDSASESTTSSPESEAASTASEFHARDGRSPAPDTGSRSPDSFDTPAHSTPSEDKTTNPPDMSLDRKLSVSMDDPSGLPEPNPDLQPESLGYVRADLNRQLEKAVSVLNTRYESELSKSFFLDVALRQILIDLHMHGEDSTLVVWLDSIFNER